MNGPTRKLLSECTAADVVRKVNEKNESFGNQYLVMADKGEFLWGAWGVSEGQTERVSYNVLNRHNNLLSAIYPNNLVEVVGKMTYQPYWNPQDACFRDLTTEQFDLLCEKFDSGDTLQIDDNECECETYYIGDQRCSCGNRRCRVQWEQYKDATWELPSGEKGFFSVSVY